jgi:hypothetical protein
VKLAEDDGLGDTISGIRATLKDVREEIRKLKPGADDIPLADLRSRIEAPEARRDEPSWRRRKMGEPVSRAR